MNLYQFRILFSIRTIPEAKLIQLDHHNYLIHAIDEEDAFRKAVELAYSEEETVYTRQYGKVQWEFEGVDSLKELRKEDGYYFLGSQTVEPEHSLAISHGVAIQYEELLKKYKNSVEA